MMDIATIRAMSRKAAVESRKNHIEPFYVEAEDIEDFKSGTTFPFPFIGDRNPRGWKKVNEYFCDSSGFGAPDEPALTRDQLIEKLRPGYGYAITEAGQFQVYVGEFELVKKAKKAA